MARIEPGIYEPSDNRVFDAAEEEEQDEGSRLPLLIVIALLVLAAFAGVVWLAYMQGMARGRSGAPPVIMAAAGPAKVAPANPGGADNPYKGLKIYEQPAPPNDDDTGAAAVSKTANNTAPPPAVATTTPPAAAPAPNAMASAAPAPKAAAPAPILRTEAATPPPAKVAEATPAPKVVTPPPAAATPSVATAPPRSLLPQTAAPIAKPAPVPIKVVEVPKPAPVKEAPAASAPASGGTYVLQIGSFKSEAEADTAWKSFQGKHASLTGGYSSNVLKVDLGEKGTWYRLRIGSFSSKDGAVSACAKLTADGASCIPSKG
jgi:hypothetical protein